MITKMVIGAPERVLQDIYKVLGLVMGERVTVTITEVPREILTDLTKISTIESEKLILKDSDGNKLTVNLSDPSNFKFLVEYSDQSVYQKHLKVLQPWVRDSEILIQLKTEEGVWFKVVKINSREIPPELEAVQYRD